VAQRFRWCFQLDKPMMMLHSMESRV
jgi:hypothetical protein